MPRVSLTDYLAETTAEPTLGYRYWHVSEEGILSAPIRRGYGDWSSGLTRSRCIDDHELSATHLASGHPCGCGLYAWEGRDDEIFCSNLYFNPSTAVVESVGPGGEYDDRNVVVVGSVALFGTVATGYPEMLRASTGFVTGLSLPPEPTSRTRRSVARAAEHYGVDIVAPPALPSHSRRVVETAGGLALRRNRKPTRSPIRIPLEEEGFEETDRCIAETLQRMESELDELRVAIDRDRTAARSTVIEPAAR